MPISSVWLPMLSSALVTMWTPFPAKPSNAWPCFYGIDTSTREQLIGSDHSEQEICDFIGADSLHYLSEEALYKASGRTGLCTACFSGKYPTELYGREEDILPKNE